MHFVSSTNDLREYLDLAGAKNINFSNISTDTRSISKDALFIAIKGPNFDGNKFIDQAFDNGAVAVLTSDTHYKKNINPACIYVPSVKEALIQIATRICDEFKGKKILITGSNGKTTCTFLLSHSLPNCSSTIGNFNNEIGLPLSVMQAKRDSEYLVLEAGAGKPGDIAILSEIVKPHLGLITSISESHTEFLGDINGVRKEKLSMLKFIKDNGYFVIDDPSWWIEDYAHLKESLERRGIIDINFTEIDHYLSKEDLDKKLKNQKHREQCGVNLDNREHPPKRIAAYVDYSDDHSIMEFEYYALDLNGEIHYSFNAYKSYLIGEHNIKNILLVAECLRIFEKNKEFSCKLEALLISDKVKLLNRLEHSSWIDGAHLINDSYNANPASVKAAVELLTSTLVTPSSAIKTNFRRRILILGNMLELKNPIESHVEIGKFINAGHIDVLITFGDLASIVAKTVKEGDVKGIECYSFESETEEDKLKIFLNDFIQKDDIVLLKGSRGMQMERFI